MRIILTQTVDKLGAAGEVCTVANGYGRNFLLPKGMAIVATPGALRQIDQIKRSESKRHDKMRGEMQDQAARIEALDLTFEARVGEQGRLHGSITAADIAEAMAAKLNEEIDRRKIHLDDSIRTLGEHRVSVHLMPGVDAKVKLTVVPDAESAHLVTGAAAEPSAVEADAPVAVQDAGAAAAAAAAAVPAMAGADEELDDEGDVDAGDAGDENDSREPTS